MRGLLEKKAPEHPVSIVGSFKHCHCELLKETYPMKRFQILLCGAAISAACAVPAFADDLVNKPPSTTAPYAGEPSDSDGRNTFPFYDQFSLTGGATITSVAWSTIIQDSTDEPLSFDISFYDNAPPDMVTSFYDNPSALLYTTHVDYHDSNPTSSSIPQLVIDPYDVFHITNFEAAIAFDAPGSGTYWISIVSNAPSTAGYGWVASDAGTANEGRMYWNTSHSYVNIGGPVAFDLTGTLDSVATPPSMPTSATPEPSSLVLMGSGMLALVGAGRRRFARR
jgi:hypothetical protein